MIVDRADRVLEPLPQRGGTAILAAYRVFDLGRVAQAADPAAQHVERVRKEAIAHGAEATQQRLRLRLAIAAYPGQDRFGLSGATLLQPAQSTSQPVDVEVQDRGRELSPAAGTRGPQPAEQRPLLEAPRGERRQAILQETNDDVEVACGADHARQLAQHAQGPSEPP